MTGETAKDLSAEVDEFLASWFGVRQQIQGLNFNRAHLQGVSTTQFMVLRFLDEATTPEQRTIKALATRLSIDPATVVRTVDSLEKRGLVARRRDTRDRRQVFVEFTAEGRDSQQLSERRFKNSLAAIFNNMSEQGRQALLQGLREFLTVNDRLESARMDATRPDQR